MPPAVCFEGVWKAYPRWTPGTRTTKDIILRRLPALMRYGDQRWVLRDIELEVEPGESLGIIGHNGAGKSTLLRLAAGLGRPTRGRITHAGDIRALLTLGDTFDITLSGRENAITAALIAGLSQSEARRRLPAIFEFAELEAFADAPVRSYSEGMKLRLAMGVAMQIPARILLIDELLAVGDLNFQHRCLEQVRALRERGTTLLLASHDIDRVTTECDRVLWLAGGLPRLLGPAATTVDEYRRAMISETMRLTPAGRGDATGELELGRTRFGSQELTIQDVRLEPAGGEVLPGQDLTVSMRLVAGAAAPRTAIVAVAVNRRRDGVKCLDANTSSDGIAVRLEPGGTDVRVAFERPALAPGDYHVEVGAYRQDWNYAYDIHVGAYPLRVLGEAGHEGVLEAPRRWGVAA